MTFELLSLIGEEIKESTLKITVAWTGNALALFFFFSPAVKMYSLLKEKILEAESIAVANVVESINTHAQLYLDSFFVDNPIVVRLLPFKETKKNNKPQINIEIQYKEMECDLNMLSGGELSRVVLAFTLALGEMFNTPMLLLDESTASLDQEATTVVFDSIKENFKGKMVLIIAHQVIQGVFDKIIKL
jgi:ABC-type lipoprotein export system ATPase subunit